MRKTTTAKAPSPSVYRTFEELNNKTLKRGDIVFIKGVKHEVCKSFLNCVKPGISDNDTSFKQYRIAKHRLATSAYGYTDGGGDWPESQIEDYEALTRLTLALMMFNRGDEAIEIKMPSGSWRRLDLSHFVK